MAKNNREVVAIADDATGALDVAGSLFFRGYDPLVLLCETDIIDGTNSIVFDLNSRYEDPANHQRNFAGNLLSISNNYTIRNIFLKVDSTLRGHIQEDVESLAEVFADRVIFIAPAFPHAGRVCINGNYFVDEKPITETVFARDRSFRIKSAKLAINFPTARHIGIGIVEQGLQAIVDEISRSGSRLLTFDTVSQSDLESIATAASLIHATCVGSSGLARAFPLNGDLFQSNEDALHHEIPSLFIIGSMHPRSRQQRDALRDLGLFEIVLEKSDLSSSRKLQLISDQIQDCLSYGNSAVLSSPDIFENDISYMGDIEEAMCMVTTFSDPIHNLILVGGKTARGILMARAIHSLHICGEFEPGIPISQPTGENLWHIVTKAGGFGSQYVLNLIYRSIYGSKV